MFSNWIQNLLKLSDRTHSLKEKTAKNADFGIEDQDSRLVALSGIQQSLLSCCYWLNTYYSISMNHQDESKILKYAGSNLSLEKTAKIMLDQIKLGLVLFIHFKLENLFGCLLNKVSNKKFKSLSATFSELSKEIGINDILKKVKIIKAFSSIRNSLHNNGVHAHPSFSIEISGVNYEFVEDGVVQCASLDHSINILDALIDIIEEVLNTEKIKNLREIIPDTYAKWFVEHM